MKNAKETTTHVLTLTKDTLKDLIVDLYGSRWKNADFSIICDGKRNIRGVSLTLTEEVKLK